jgi:chemotaxis signal transduction protein
MNVSTQNDRYRLKAEEMRRAFDQAFASPDRTQSAAIDDLLAIRVAGRPFALRLNEIARIEFGNAIVPVSGSDPWLLGLANVQGKLVPIHSLEKALGLESTMGNRWLAVAGRDEQFGLAFEAFEQYLRIPRTEFFKTAAADSHEMHGQVAVRGAGELRPVIDLSSVAAAIRGRTDSSGTTGKVPRRPDANS